MGWSCRSGRAIAFFCFSLSPHYQSQRKCCYSILVLLCQQTVNHLFTFHWDCILIFRENIFVTNIQRQKVSICWFHDQNKPWSSVLIIEISVIKSLHYVTCSFCFIISNNIKFHSFQEIIFDIWSTFVRESYQYCTKACLIDHLFEL